MLEQFDPALVVKPIAPEEGSQSLCLKVVGRLAGDSAHLLRRAIDPVFTSPQPPKVRLLMEGVQYMDSTGVGVIIAIIQQMRHKGGKLEICGLSEVGRQLFHILRLTTLSDCVSFIPN